MWFGCNEVSSPPDGNCLPDAKRVVGIYLDQPSLRAGPPVLALGRVEFYEGHHPPIGVSQRKPQGGRHYAICFGSTPPRRRRPSGGQTVEAAQFGAESEQAETDP